MSNSNRYNLLLTGLIFFLILGCSTSEKGVRKGPPPEDSTLSAYEDLTSLDFLLFMSRSSLSDLYASQQHDMPDNFLKKANAEPINNDPFDGYRVQIISTRNRPLADSVAQDFRMWSDTTVAGYTANSYVFFEQPNYKVHVGDFQQREQALSFTQMLKNKYPGAWVVHDRIDPAEVPADTATFSIISTEDRLKRMAADSLES